jgi:hypothetical protein
VAAYSDEAQLAKDPHIKDYAAKNLPTLKQHYQQAQQTATALGLPNSAEAQPAGARMQGEQPGSSGLSPSGTGSSGQGMSGSSKTPGSSGSSGGLGTSGSSGTSGTGSSGGEYSPSSTGR